MHHFVFLLIYFSFLFSDQQHQEIRIEGEMDQVQAFSIRNVPFFQCKEGSKTITQITAMPADQWTQNPQFHKTDMKKHHDLWMKIPLHFVQNDQLRDRYILEFMNQSIPRLSVYIPNEEQVYQEFEAGSHLKFNQREIAHKNFSFFLPSPNTGSMIVYARLSTDHQPDTHFSIKSTSGFIHYATTEYIYFGLIYGSLISLLIYALLLLMSMRNEVYCIILFYILCLLAWLINRDGIGFQYFWPSYSGGNQQIAHLFEHLIVLNISWLFGKKFKIKHQHPQMHLLLLVLLGTKTILLLLGLVLNEYFPLEVILNILIYGSLLIHIFPTGGKSATIARPIFIGQVVLFIGIILQSGLRMGLLELSPLTYYASTVAFLFHILSLFFALAMEAGKSQQDKNVLHQALIKEQQAQMDLKEQLNQELEQKVRERTLEIAQKNQELKRAFDELEQQAIPEKVRTATPKPVGQQAKKQQTMEKSTPSQLMSFGEFKTIFPDELACFRYLEKIKWQEGYKCTKCNNKKYADGIKPFSRRCSKCGYCESICSNTIFHSTKFDICKAFYLVYLINNNLKVNQTEIARAIDLRLGTVNRFILKIKSYNGKLDHLLKEF
ncbi:7TM diverse intracellular signaling domain-containing protein [Persicobacter diffluens]|uniref:7TM-DISM receptor extracellular domain-containing protein n=1 Tax=Persicobacter diffluens TaxID=981 RepID=A0AAN5ANF5_9BACT|nr:hypothetical protein PEDI_38480 [Persicobacter diffluens]